MRTGPKDRPATSADLEALPSNVVGEIVRGVLYASPRPALPHAGVASSLGDELGPPFNRGRGGPGGWLLLDEPELHLLEDIIVPDLAGWRRERLPTLPRAPFLTLAPDWVCEVSSPSTVQLDRAEKLPVYAREQVDHVWLVDPLQRMLEVLRLDGATYRILGTHFDDATVRLAPFDAIEIELKVLWER